MDSGNDQHDMKYHVLECKSSKQLASTFWVARHRRPSWALCQCHHWIPWDLSWVSVTSKRNKRNKRRNWGTKDIIQNVVSQPFPYMLLTSPANTRSRSLTKARTSSFWRSSFSLRCWRWLTMFMILSSRSSNSFSVSFKTASNSLTSSMEHSPSAQSLACFKTCSCSESLKSTLRAVWDATDG